MKNNYRYCVVVLIAASFALCGSVSAQSHPCLLFDDIAETPGYQFRTEEPWSSWESSLITSANSYLSKDFSGDLGAYDRIIYRSSYARTLAFAYQITKNSQYSNKAKEALLNLDKGDQPYDMDRATALMAYSVAYDWIQPTLSQSEDQIIRDKLALLADRVYGELNGNGSSLSYVTFADYHGQAYPCVGAAGAVLSDYTNPNNIAISSSPEDWQKVGTDYLFDTDGLHSYDRSLLSFGFDETSGKHLNGAYKSYVISEFVWWIQIYSHYYSENIIDKYPAVKKAFTSELWESMPNHYQNNYCTSGNTREWYLKGIINLLSDTEKSNILWHLESIDTDLLPYSSGSTYLSGDLLYSTYEDYSSIPRAAPSWTSHLDENAIYQVFRSNWNADSDWLSLVTFNVQSLSNRDSAHHDQLGIEYYGKGDLLLADGGETKHILDGYYGQYSVYHNVIAIENPREQFSVSSRTGSTARGIYKGNSGGIVTPVTISNIIQNDWMEYLKGISTISRVIKDTYSESMALSSPIEYSREILHPDEEYFVVIDRADGNENWVYRTIFRPSSLNIVPTGSTIGHVVGDLYIGDDYYDWESLPYKEETGTGISTNLVRWETLNPYNQNVIFSLYSEPSSEILITKHTGRIAGYNTANEVYCPIIQYRCEPSSDMYRITTLSSRYEGEDGISCTSISVNGIGSAVSVQSETYEDFIYTGEGESSFDQYYTDANTVFTRKESGGESYSTLIEGTYLKNGSTMEVQSLHSFEYLTLEKKESTGILRIKCDDANVIKLYHGQRNVDEVLRDGGSYSDWALSDNGDTLVLNTAAGEHEYIIHYSDAVMPVAPPGDINNNGEIDIGDVMMVTYMAAGLIEEDICADFNGNGYIDVGDASKINYYFLGLIDEL